MLQKAHYHTAARPRKKAPARKSYVGLNTRGVIFWSERHSISSFCGSIFFQPKVVPAFLRYKKLKIPLIATISLGLQPGAPLWVAAVIVFGVFVLSMIIHTLYAVAFSTPVMVAAYGRARRYVQATLGAFFTFAGVKLLTDPA